MKMIIGAAYKLNRRLTVGEDSFNEGEVFTLKHYNSESEVAALERGPALIILDSDYLTLVDEPSKPAHYDTGIDTIAFLRANCPTEQVEGFLRGNALKYLQRYDKKNGVEDLRKAKHYVEMLIEEVEGRE